jgi:signal-transduction protein with cAMP-binding, CBS, and nucleotidyltransferase domain
MSKLASPDAGQATLVSSCGRPQIAERIENVELTELIREREPVTAGPNDTIASVTLAMQKHNVGSVIIVENQIPVGIVTDRDLAVTMGVQGNSPQTPIQNVMTTNVRTIQVDADIFTAVTYMRHYGVRRLPLIDRKGRVAGMVSMDDVMRTLSRELYHLGQAINHEMEAK